VNEFVEFLERVFSAIDLSTGVGKLTYLAIVIVLAALFEHFVVKTSSNALKVAEVPQASIFVNILRGFIWSLALLFVLRPVFGIEPTAFVTALGVTSFAVSLGMQDTISSLFSGLTLMVSRIIMPGDYIKVGNFTGKVADITWRSTIVESRAGDVECIPNSVLSKTSFTKLTERSATAATMKIAVDKHANYAQVADEISAVAVKELGDLAMPWSEPRVRFGDVDAFSVNVTLTVYIWPDASIADAVDLISRGLEGKPWQAGMS
jgi:small-conductance mechanosensitive channel